MVTDIQPAEYRADLVTTLVDETGTPVMGINVEVQLARDEGKRFVWLSDVANPCTRLKCPVCLLVVTMSESVARWAAEPFDFDGDAGPALRRWPTPTATLPPL